MKKGLKLIFYETYEKLKACRGVGLGKKGVVKTFAKFTVGALHLQYY